MVFSHFRLISRRHGVCMDTPFSAHRFHSCHRNIVMNRIHGHAIKIIYMITPGLSPVPQNKNSGQQRSEHPSAQEHPCSRCFITTRKPPSKLPGDGSALFSLEGRAAPRKQHRSASPFSADVRRAPDAIFVYSAGRPTIVIQRHVSYREAAPLAGGHTSAGRENGLCPAGADESTATNTAKAHTRKSAGRAAAADEVD